MPIVQWSKEDSEALFGTSGNGLLIMPGPKRNATSHRNSAQKPVPQDPMLAAQDGLESWLGKKRLQSQNKT
jgi:hypothetical protein